VAHDSDEAGTDLVAGGKESSNHLVSVNYPGDLQADLRGDSAQVQAGDRSIEHDEPLQLMTGIEIVNTFKLGTYYSDRLDAQYLGADGRRHPFVMGSSGIGVGRLAASVVERYHDANGIIWPVSVAPYDVHIVQLGTGDVAADAERLAEGLEEAGLSVLLDDRGDSAGVKFNDADLMPGGSGVRAQALDRKGNLVDDFAIETSPRMLHVLNAPSPGATASLAIGDTLADRAAEMFGL